MKMLICIRPLVRDAIKGTIAIGGYSLNIGLKHEPSASDETQIRSVIKDDGEVMVQSMGKNRAILTTAVIGVT